MPAIKYIRKFLFSASNSGSGSKFYDRWFVFLDASHQSTNDSSRTESNWLNDYDGNDPDGGDDGDNINDNNYGDDNNNNNNFLNSIFL